VGWPSTPKKEIVDRLIFLVESPFGARDSERLGLASLPAQDVKVTVLDCSAAFGNHEQPTGGAGREPGIEVEKLSTVEDVKRAVASATSASAVFICLVAARWKTLPLFHVLRKSNARYALLLADVQPFGDTALRAGLSGGLSSRLRELRQGRLPLGRWLLRLAGVPSPELIVAGGECSLSTAELRLADVSATVLWAHALDYDRFLRLPAEAPRNGAVFLDQFLERHPDQLRSGTPFCNPKTYYSNLRRAFDVAESSLGEPLIIAAHPSSDYSDRDPRFGGRKIIRGRTAELVAGSRWVLAHDSTATGYAVLAGIPVTFITDNGIEQSPVRRAAGAKMASVLGRRRFNLDVDSLPPWEMEAQFDPDAYARYRSCYLKRDGSENKLLWAIVVSHLRGETAGVPLSSVST
jgi:hypothetical protein